MKKAPAPEGARHQTRSQYSTAGGYPARQEAISATLLENAVEPANMEDFLSRLANSDGKFTRTGSASKPHSKNLWGLAFHDRGLPVVVIAGDWATGAEMKWVAGNVDAMTPTERRALKRRMAEAKRAREEEQARQWEARAAAAVHRWHSCTPADPLHPYLQSKGIQPHRARQQGRELVLLLADFSGKGWSLQTIDEAGGQAADGWR